jgi:DNA replication protein DnaC
MSDLQHQRIVGLCQELRLSAMPNVYSGIAQSAATKEASFADFLEETLRAERDARSARAREMFARIAGSVPSTAEGSGTPQCAVIGLPGQTGQTSPAA